MSLRCEQNVSTSYCPFQISWNVRQHEATKSVARCWMMKNIILFGVQSIVRKHPILRIRLIFFSEESPPCRSFHKYRDTLYRAMGPGSFVIPSGGRFVKCPRVDRSKGIERAREILLLMSDRIFLPRRLIRRSVIRRRWPGKLGNWPTSFRTVNSRLFLSFALPRSFFF